MGKPGVFEAYSRYYDLLYTDKDYIGEADYVAATLARNEITRGALLEFGSGTGKHGRLLAAKGFEVIGIERSPEMVAVATGSPIPGPLNPDSDAHHRRSGSFSCRNGDIRSARVDQSFDAVLALFHVVSYQTSNDDVRGVFASAAAHLSARGLFFFDVWHGPAVLTQRPTVRVKRMEDAKTRILRVAEPEIDTNRNLVTVNYTVLVEDRTSNRWHNFKEAHAMRYFFPPEIALLAAESGFDIVRSEEFFTGTVPSESTWSVAYLLRKR
jgi:SAM-dependent methyltransferase